MVNDATSVVLFRAVQKLTFDDFTGMEVLHIGGSFLSLFFSSTILGVVVSLSSFPSHVRHSLACFLFEVRNQVTRFI